MIPRNQNNKPTSYLSIEQGKIPPQCVDIEECVLGAMLLDQSCIDEVASILKAESFYRDENQKIFQSIIDLKNAGKVVDILTVTAELRAKKELEEVGGPVYISSLTSRVALSTHAIDHAEYVQESFVKRELIRLGSELVGKSYDESEYSEDIISEHSIALNHINEDTVSQTVKIGLVLRERITEIEAVSKDKSLLVGVPSGFSIDKITGGWQGTDLIILAARPSMGKTSVALSFALRACEFKYPTVFFSLEMSKKQIIDKSLSAFTNMTPIQIRTGQVDWRDMDSGISVLERLNFYIDDTAAITLIQLRSKITKLLKYGLKLAVIDYLQLMNGRVNGFNREQEISELTRGIKAICKETGLPIILLSQLNRDVEKRANKRPQLSDLRESGAIEQDADMVVFINRPEYYGIETDENGDSTKGLVELLIEKHRNGPVGKVVCYSNDSLTKFQNERMYQSALANHVPKEIKAVLPNQSFYEKDEDPPY